MRQPSDLRPTDSCAADSVPFERMCGSGAHCSANCLLLLGLFLSSKCRDHSCDIRIVNKEISRKHAEVYVEDNGAVRVYASRQLLQL